MCKTTAKGVLVLFLFFYGQYWRASGLSMADSSSMPTTRSSDRSSETTFITAGLMDPNLAVRVNTINLLRDGDFALRSYDDLLLKATIDREPRVRAAAISALGAIYSRQFTDVHAGKEMLAVDVIASRKGDIQDFKS